MVVVDLLEQLGGVRAGVAPVRRLLVLPGRAPASATPLDTIFPGCCLARSPQPEPAVATEAAAPSARLPSDRLALRLPLPPPLLSRLPDRFRCGEPRCGDGLDTAAAPCLSQSHSSSLASWSKSQLRLDPESLLRCPPPPSL